jgi:anti-sigma factor ChrR (cupin superfamily)
MMAHVADRLPDRLVGALEDSEEAYVASHLADCPECARAEVELNEIFALLASTLPPAFPDPSVRSRILADTEHGRLYRFAGHVAALFSMDEARARALLDATDDPTLWEDSPLPGVRQLIVPEMVPGKLMFFIGIPPGGEVPHHEHFAEEQTLVLSGRLRDNEGRLWMPGEQMPKSIGTEHSFRADGPYELVCGVLLSSPST